jgi:hypothetical protein
VGGTEMNFLSFIATEIVEPEFDFGYFMGLAKDILEIAKKIPGTAGMIFSAIGMLLIIFVMLGWVIWSWHQRAVRADKAKQASTLAQAKITSELQLDLAATTLDDLGVWERDYKIFVKAIDTKKYSDVYKKVALVDQSKVAEFLRNEELSSATRAALIINILKNH